MPGKPKRAVSEKKPKSQAEDHPQIEGLYRQLDEILKMVKLSKARLAVRIGMTYPGFLLSFNKRRIKMDTWLAISEFLQLPVHFRFEEGIKPVSQKGLGDHRSEYGKARLKNREELVNLYQKHIEFLKEELRRKDAEIAKLQEQ